MNVMIPPAFFVEGEGVPAPLHLVGVSGEDSTPVREAFVSLALGSLAQKTGPDADQVKHFIESVCDGDIILKDKDRQVYSDLVNSREDYTDYRRDVLMTAAAQGALTATQVMQEFGTHPIPLQETPITSNGLAAKVAEDGSFVPAFTEFTGGGYSAAEKRVARSVGATVQAWQYEFRLLDPENSYSEYELRSNEQHLL